MEVREISFEGGTGSESCPALDFGTGIVKPSGSVNTELEHS
jgi:hypothetical protein